MIAIRPDREIGTKFIHLESVASTNNYSAKLLLEGRLSHGTVILADEQTKGRGQQGSQWQSEPKKNIQVSIFVDPQNLKIEHQKCLNFIACLTVVSTLLDFGIESEIKWPNDIYVGTKKICGVLVETQLRQNLVRNAIVGIGLNVNQLDFGDLNATSIQLESKTEYSIEEVLQALVSNFSSYYNTMVLEQYKVLEKIYLKKMLGLETERSFVDKNGLFSGKIIGLSQDGQLRISVQDEIRTYNLKEVEFLFD